MKRLFCILAMWLAAWQLSFALAQTQEETAVITLSGESAQWTGDGVTLEDGVLTIGGTGVYRLSGSWAEGQIVVKAGKKGYVTLVLDGLSVSSSEGSPLTVTSAKEVVLRLEAGSGNTLTSIAEGEDAASALVSKADLFLTGEGSLTLQSSGKHGIQAADSVTVQGGSYVIEAAKTGLRANDFIAVTGGALEIASGEDGVRVSGDESKPDTGWIAVSGGSLRIASGEDGIQAETDVTLTGGSIYIESGDDGIRAENTLKITDGESRSPGATKGWKRRKSSWTAVRSPSRRRTTASMPATASAPTWASAAWAVPWDGDGTARSGVGKREQTRNQARRRTAHSPEERMAVWRIRLKGPTERGRSRRTECPSEEKRLSARTRVLLGRTARPPGRRSRIS